MTANSDNFDRRSERKIDFVLKIGGYEVNAHDYFQGFTMSIAKGESTHTVISLFDSDYTSLLEVVFALRQLKNKISFAFGWHNALCPEIETELFKYEPTFTPQGLELKLLLMPSPAIIHPSKIEKRSWPAGTRPSAIVEWIGQELGFKKMYIEKSDPINQVIIFPGGEENPLGWIKRMFCYSYSDGNITPSALPVTAGGDRSPYELVIDGNGDLHFHTRYGGYKPKVSREYIFGSGACGRVISFAPTDNDVLWRMLGGGGTEKYVALESVKEVDVKTAGEDDGTRIESVDGSKTGVREPRVGTIPIISALSIDKDAAQKEADSRWRAAAAHKYTATLEVIGDPFLNILDIVNVLILLPGTQKTFPFSGKYQITSIEHVIDSNGFITRLGLVKEGLPA